jgi:hypothetical protein
MKADQLECQPLVAASSCLKHMLRKLVHCHEFRNKKTSRNKQNMDNDDAKKV